jgi:pSer/pThr/pTyr-binding forkhead associated (FHA) protein
MHSVTLVFTHGPMAGERAEYDLGALTFGREPAPMESGQLTMVLKGAERSVSRSHATLLDSDAGVILRNLSGNGTLVDGKLVLEDAVLKSGASIRVGTSHEFLVNWEIVGAETAGEERPTISAGALAKAGPLASPVVRALLGVYLLGILGVVGWLMTRPTDGTHVADDWPTLEPAYAEYIAENLDEQTQAARMEKAAGIVNQLRVLRIKERTEDVNHLCRELMAIDADIKSPVYRYGAKCLGGF